MEADLVDINAQGPQVLLRLIDLEHEFLMSFRHVVKGEDSPTEFEEEVCAEGDEDPKGELVKFRLAYGKSTPFWGGVKRVRYVRRGRFRSEL